MLKKINTTLKNIKSRVKYLDDIMQNPEADASGRLTWPIYRFECTLNDQPYQTLYLERDKIPLRSIKMSRLLIILFLMTGLVSLSLPVNAQFKVSTLQFHYGMGSQSIFPFQSGSYTYNTHYFKFHIGFPISHKHKFSLSWNLEPSIYLVNHQLTNQWYELNTRDATYAAKIPSFLEMKRINEYVINIGFQMHYSISDRWGIYGLISAGPMYSDTETERLAKGFAFSDIVGIGFQYLHGNITSGIRISMRHVSNANLKLPNNGHNSSNIELSVGYLLDN